MTEFQKVQSNNVYEKLCHASLTYNSCGKWNLYKNQLKSVEEPIDLTTLVSLSESNSQSSKTQPKLPFKVRELILCNHNVYKLYSQPGDYFH